MHDAIFGDMANLTGTTGRQPRMGELLEGIGRDVRTIAVDEIELARNKLTGFIEQLVLKASVALLGTFVALVGLAMLCIVAVVAAAPIIPQLWLRLLIMAFVYMGVGAAATVLYTKRLARATSSIKAPIDELGNAADAVKHGLEH